ncbi:type II secretion system F family protein [bacterium]|nr:type II secretion system F family protein [bacterium]
MLELALVTLVITIVLLGLGIYRSSAKYAVAQRIDALREEETQTTGEELQKPFLQRVVLPLGDAVSRLFRNYTPAETAERNQKKLVRAGLYPRMTPAQFQGLCWFSAAGCLILMFLIVTTFSRAGGNVQLRDPMNIAYLLIAVVAGFMLPQFILSRRIAARQEDILVTLPYGIDLLSISVEAGLGFDAAVGYTMRKVKGPLAEEFAKTLNEIRLGKPRLEALEDLGNRAGVEELKIFVTAVVHASRLGGSITETLRVQADSIRVRHRQRVQEMAMKAPVKMVFPLVLFIFPALFVVILGPALISIMRNI